MYFGIWSIELVYVGFRKNWGTDCKNLSFEEAVDKFNYHLINNLIIINEIILNVESHCEHI